MNNTTRNRSVLHRSTLIFIAFAAIALGSKGILLGQTVVTVDAAGFQPNMVTIGVGSSVLWLNLDPDLVHTTTSDRPVGDPDYWNVSLNYFQFYTRTFARAGTFTYHDSVGGFTGTVTVTAPELNAPRLVNGWFVFDATGLSAGKTNVLQSSTNLATWTAVQTNTATGSSLTFSNAPVDGWKFYRLVELP